MATLTRQAVEDILGPVDDALIVEIAATGATPAELREAQAWVTSDDALVNDFRPMPKGKVAELVDILYRQEGPAGEEDMA